MSEKRVSTTYLGQFGYQRADRVAKALGEAGITWWRKEAGRLTRFLFIGEWGVRLYVDSSRLGEAREIVAKVSTEGG